MPLTTDFTATPFYQKEDVALTLTMSSATNVSGWTVEFCIWNPFDPSAAPLVRLDNASLGGVAITDANLGVFTVTIPSADMGALAEQEWRWEFFRKNLGAYTELGNGKWPVKTSKIGA